MALAHDDVQTSALASLPVFTAAVGFHSIEQRKGVFTVASGVPIRSALEQASCMLSAAETVSEEIGCTPGRTNENLAWANFFMVEMAKALVDACIGGLAEVERGAA